MDASTCRVDGPADDDGAARSLRRPSALKRRKVAEITRLLGPTPGLHCLDLGGDNGVVSRLLRQRGGVWTSADIDDEAAASIRRLVKDRVHRLDGVPMPFDTNQFDRVVIVDLLEHVQDDRGFVVELSRVLKPAGELIVNVPHARDGVLRRLRGALGQSDEAHGHVRPGYTRQTLRGVLAGYFDVVAERTYSRAASELLDIASRGVTARLKRGRPVGAKGVLLVEEDVRRHPMVFVLQRLAEPLARSIVALDRLLVGTDGYMLIVKARSLKTGEQS